MKFKPKTTILTAGPWITKREIRYVTQAVSLGWNAKWNNFTKRFEEAFADYIGVKYAMTTGGGTHALQIGLACLGVGSGDEVILPEITYFACSDVIVHSGATPVFVDVLRDTWCIDPKSCEKAITRRTKAIMPVHIYGNPAEMDEVLQIAHKYNLRVIEDACPAIGATFHSKHPGSFGDLGAFSFQGAKIMVTGIGGMLVTNNKTLYNKMLYLNNHGEDAHKKFWQTAVAYESRMPNIAAALGLAQLERIETFVRKKRQIFSWYQKRLGNIDGISMNQEHTETRSNYWMSSIILDKDFGISRDQIREKLRSYRIDTRPFFYPISMFPMFKEAKTPIAHHVGLNGINLPSGLMLKENEVDYVCRTVRKILNV